MESLLLYALPIGARVILEPRPDAVDVVLSLIPLLVVLPSLVLPRWISNHEREHVGRHAVYAVAFALVTVCSVRWSVVVAAVRSGTSYAIPLIAYLAVGTATLAWFCVSHMLENAWFPTLRTHQGDVAVLPLTLVAIATFAESIPDDAVRYSRSILFFVPVVVAWATLHFVAYLGFATRTVTTHTDEGFLYLAHSGLVIASAQLLLLEVRARPLWFQIFPVVAAVLCQVTRPVKHRPAKRPMRLLGQLVVGAGAGTAYGAILSRRFLTGVSYSIGVATGIVGPAAAALLVDGAHWIVAATLYAALLSAATLDAVHDPAPSVLDALLLFGGPYLVLHLCQLLAPATHPSLDPPHDVPPTAPDYTPQTELPSCSRSRILEAWCGVPLACTRRRYDSTTVDVVLASSPPPHPHCPDAFGGVWWMKGNILPMELVCVHGSRWRIDRETFAYHWDWLHTTRNATLGGLFLHCLSLFTKVRITVVNDRWIRTDGWFLGPLRLFPNAYWLYRCSEHEMLRLVFDAHGRVVWQYRMLRVAYPDGTRTRHHADFLDHCEGRGYLLA